MAKYYTQEIPKTDRIPRLVAHLYAKMPEIESARARLITESYKATEDKPVIMRRALAFAHILDNIPIIRSSPTNGWRRSSRPWRSGKPILST